MSFQRIVILTGAGISAESGLATFRDNNGLWCNHRIEDVATPEAFGRNPTLVHQFYSMRRLQLKQAIPNAAHHALGKLASQWKGPVLLVTQNVDDLHDRAMQLHHSLLHMHGELTKVRCRISEQIFDWDGELNTQSKCSCCGKPGRLRPHIVWFGEMPLYMDVIQSALEQCDLFISIGTSGQVYPAAGFVQTVRRNGRGHCVELNMEPSAGQSLFHEHIYGKATEIVPAYIEKLLGQNG
jgi:NAD-dependent deacetylase